MIEQKRVNISHLARQVREQGVEAPSTHSDPLLRECLPGSVEAEEFWNDIKPEYFALLSILTDRVVSRAYDARNQRKPFGLIERSVTPGGKGYDPFETRTIIDLDQRRPFGSLSTAMRDTLAAALVDEIVDLEVGQESPQLQAVFNRTRAILERVSEVYPRLRNIPETAIGAGINTASNFMAGLLGVIPEVGGVDDPDLLIQIARNSHPLVNKVAMGHSDVSINFIDKIKGPGSYLPSYPFNPDFFAVEEDLGRPRLEFSASGLAALEDIRRQIDEGYKDEGIEPSVTVGCPAMINFGDGSAIRKLWDWHVEIAEQVYPTLTSSNR